MKQTHTSFGISAAAILGLIPNIPATAQPQPQPGRSAQAAAAQATATAKAPRAPTASGDVPRATFIQMMDADYRKRDLDGDGKVTRAEFEQFERNGAITAAQAQNRALFATLDTDRNGTLTAGEFAGLVRNIPTPDITGQMQRFDINRDQIVSLIEYRTATLINFDRLDADKDGIVTEREIAASNSSIGGR